MSCLRSMRKTGDGWIPSVPRDWALTKLKYVARFVNGAPFKPADWSDTGVPIIRIENLNGSEEFNYSPVEVDTKYEIREGDLLFAWSGNIGTSFGPSIWNRPGLHYLNQHIFRVTGYRLDKRYFYWALRAVTTRVESEVSGIIGLVHVTKHELGSIPIPIPSGSEQRAIADFLDHETAKIDCLVGKKQELLTLLQSRQEAAVRHLVVGHDLDVPKRASGYSWLGDVPSHWKVLALKRIAKRVIVGIAEASTHAYADSGVPLIRTTNVKANRIDVADLRHITREFADTNRSRYMRAGDIVTARTGNPGISGVVPPELNGSQCFTMLITTLRDQHVPEFFCYYINSEPARTYFALEGWGTAQINISVPILQTLPVPCPPEKEQRHIAERIKSATEVFDCQVHLINEAIERLREYRSSLISATVTGQIDVSNYRPQEAAALCQ
jgi:type I restriction enzyme, S subunit